MAKRAGQLGAYCAANPHHSLTAAAEPIMSK